MANLSHSRRSIKFMESMAKFCTFLAIIPYYNFDKKQIERKKLYKSYTVAIVFLLISTIIFTEYNSWNIFYIKEDTLLFGLTKTLKLNSLILFLMTSLGSAFWNLERWEHFFKSFAYLEDYFNTEACLENNYFKHLCSQFIISNVCLLSHLPFVLISVKYNALLMTLQLCLFFVFYIKFTKSLVIFNLTLAMKCKYQDLNSCLCEGCFGMGSDIRKTILRVSNFYGKMNGIVNDFNKLFGWELLLNITHTFVLVMICFNHINWYFFKKAHETLNVSATVVLCLISVGLLSMAGPILVMFSCDWAVKEAEKLVTTCYKYQAYFPTFSEEKQELLNLANQIINNKPVFTAAGFFEINCRTLFALFGTTTTYFIVIMQFNQI